MKVSNRQHEWIACRQPANHRLDQIVSPFALLAGFVWSATRWASEEALLKVQP
jgi:hypothetical protein